MTENEIVQYLKKNKNVGVAFAFMPEEVKNWCRNKRDRSIFMTPYEDFATGPAEERDIRWFRCRENHTILLCDPLCLVDECKKVKEK